MPEGPSPHNTIPNHFDTLVQLRQTHPNIETSFQKCAVKNESILMPTNCLSSFQQNKIVMPLHKMTNATQVLGPRQRWRKTRNRKWERLPQWIRSLRTFHTSLGPDPGTRLCLGTRRLEERQIWATWSQMCVWSKWLENHFGGLVLKIESRLGSQLTISTVICDLMLFSFGFCYQRTQNNEFLLRK